MQQVTQSVSQWAIWRDPMMMIMWKDFFKATKQKDPAHMAATIIKVRIVTKNECNKPASTVNNHYLQPVTYSPMQMKNGNLCIHSFDENWLKDCLSSKALEIYLDKCM